MPDWKKQHCARAHFFMAYRSLMNLIAFNAKIHKNRLITFPSLTELLVTASIILKPWRHIRGSERNASKPSYPILVLHFRTYPNRPFESLHRRSLNSRQLKWLSESSLANQRYEDFFNEDKFEAFVKNLEPSKAIADTIILSGCKFRKPPQFLAPCIRGERRSMLPLLVQDIFIASSSLSRQT